VVVVLVAIAAVIVLFLVAWLVVGLVLKLLWWALIGLAIGALARLILPGKQTLGILATAVAGIAAAFLGGVIAHIFGFGSVLQFVIAVLGAIIIVAILSSSNSPARA
jgi:uncharacterized membrane protein YeaQ/YmgE (transglycosylase-associated protein family)